MVKSGWHVLVLVVLLVAGLMLAGCGSGTGAASSAASLGLVVDKTTAAAGVDSVTATVTLTSLSSQPVNGVSIDVDLVYNGSVITTRSGSTNTSGVVVLQFPIALITSDRTYYLQARSSGLTPSSSVPVAIKAPVLASTIPTTTTKSAVAGSTVEYVLQGDTVTFADGNGTAIAGVPVTFTLTSQTGATSSVLLHNSAPFVSFTTAPTDGAGIATTSLTSLLTASATTGDSTVTTFYYTLSATYNGLSFTRQLSTQFTLTASAASSMTFAPTSAAFALADAANTTITVTVTGGTAPYGVYSSNSADITASIIGNVVTVTKTTVAGPTASTAKVFVYDAVGAAAIIQVTYFK